MIMYLVNTKEKRHVVGGVLMSAAFLFGGLAITVVTIKSEEDDHYGR